MKTRGSLIVMEGLDGAGTTTQTQRLHDHFFRDGTPVWATFEPTDGPIGRLIRDALSGKVLSPQSGGPAVFSENALCLLFAADRIEHSRDIEPTRTRPAHIVCDRYIWSSIAYQSTDPSISPERVIEANRGCSVPDVTLWLNVPVETCLARLQRRDDTATIYEKKETLAAIHTNYEKTRELYEKHFGPVIDIDGSAPVEDVERAVCAAVAPFV